MGRTGLVDDAVDGATMDTWADTESVLAGLAIASVQGRVALGARLGQRVRRRGDPPEEADPPARNRCHAHQNGFDLHAALRVPAGHRNRLEPRSARDPPVLVVGPTDHTLNYDTIFDFGT